MKITKVSDPEVKENIEIQKHFHKRNVYRFHKHNGPKISIITVTYNSAATLADTLESVQNQNYSNVEHIIIDGHSKDKTVEIIKSFPHVTRWISEKDTGLYHAMNKGVQLATGDIIGILNSDDIYANNNVLSKVAYFFEKENPDTVYGDLNYVDAENMNIVVRKWKSGGFRKSNFYYGWMPPHPTFFVKKEIYNKVGLFDMSLKIAADYELMLRILFKHGFTSKYLPEVLVKMRSGGISNGTIKNRIKANKEDRMAWQLNNLNPYFFTLYLKPIRKLFQFVNKENIRKLLFLNYFFLFNACLIFP
jgi:glycosyltransferase